MPGCCACWPTWRRPSLPIAGNGRAWRTRPGQEEQAQRQLAEGIRIRLEGAGREARDQEGRVAALDQQQADWQRRDLPAKAALVLREPELRADLTQLERRREALLGEQEQISLRYERLVNDLDRRHTQAEAAAGQVRTELYQGFEPRLRDIGHPGPHGPGAAARRAQPRAGRPWTAACARRWRPRANGASAPAPPRRTPELVATREATRALVDARVAERDQAQAKARQAAAALAQAKVAHQDLEAQRARLVRQRDDLERQRQARLLQQSPGEDSLLHFLRSRRPDWVFDIAKVVREDLLVRTDLAPELIETLPALYGVGLDLGHLDAHLAADEGALRREIADLADQRAALAGELKQADQALIDCDRGRRQADEQLSLANAAVQQAQAAIRVRPGGGQGGAAPARSGSQGGGAAAMARLAELEGAEAGLKAELAALERQHQAAVKAREAEQAQARQATEAERDQALAAHDRERDQARALHAEAGAAIRAERDSALGAAGVDTAALKRLERDIEAAQVQLQAIERSRDEVGQWHLWQRNEWPRRDGHDRAAQAARDLEAKARTDLAAEERRWKARRAELEAATQGPGPSPRPPGAGGGRGARAPGRVSRLCGGPAGDGPALRPRLGPGGPDRSRPTPTRPRPPPWARPSAG